MLDTGTVILVGRSRGEGFTLDIIILIWLAFLYFFEKEIYPRLGGNLRRVQP